MRAAREGSTAVGGWRARRVLGGLAALLGAASLAAPALAAPCPAGAIGVASHRAATAPANVGGPTTLYDNTGNPSNDYYGGQGGNEAIDDLHMTAGGSLDTLVFECFDPAVGDTFSAAVTIYGNPGGLDLATSPLLGTYEVSGISRGRQIVAVPLPDAPSVLSDIWVGVRFSSTTAGLIRKSVPTVGCSHDRYVENDVFYLDFGGSPQANFALRVVDTPTHGLTLITVGQGSVTRDPELTAYVEGATVRLTPVPDAHWHFVGWSGDASGTDDPLLVVMDGDKTVTATFAIDTHTLTYTAGPNGTISGANPQTVDHGASGTEVTAVGDPGYHFVSWSDGVLTAARTESNVVADFGVTATFARDDLACNGGFEVDLAGWARVGSVELTRVTPGRASAWAMRIKSKSSSDCGIADLPLCIGSGRTTLGDTYRFTAWVLAGSSSSRGRRVKLRIYEYDGWSQVGSYASTEVRLGTAWQKLTLDYVVRRTGTSLSERLIYDPDESGEFFFVDDFGIELLPPPVRFTITAGASAGGSIAPSGAVTVNQGDAKTFTITPNPGYQIQDVVLDGTTSLGAVGSFTFTNVQANRSIQASFAVIPPGQNLVGNPSFESGIQNWTTYGDARLWWKTDDGHTGLRSLQVIGGDASNGCDDKPNWVTQVAGVGRKYQFQAWVKRGNTSSTGKVKIRVYELAGSSQVGSTVYSQEIPLTSDWQLLTALHTVRQAGTSLSMRVTNGSSNQTFLVDDVSISLVAPAPGAALQSLASEDVALEFARPTVYPNPARRGATLALSLARPGALRAELYDVAGRLIRVVADAASAPAGTHRFALERGRGTTLGAGIYFYRVEIAGVRHRGRFVVVE